MRFMIAALIAGSLLLSARLAKGAPDAHSYANTDDFLVTHAALNLSVDFARSRLNGFVDLTVTRSNAEARSIVLDTRDLTVLAVELVGSSPQALQFKVGARDAILGAPLAIELPELRAKQLTLRVHYETGPGASGLQWLAPAQTAGKSQPFMYSQSQAIHARSWIPLQDTPQVRFTYEARIKTPPQLLAVMSAANDPAAVRDGEYEFKMPQAIPSYLMALAVGDLEFKGVGARTGVYAEPGVLAAAAHEFADVESMLTACEKLFGPYRWGRYDLLVLPPSFLLGGMENPRLSFITPTVIAGDRSLVSIIAHELAHSWSGNLVTNASWDSVWLNEGLTTYLERRIVEALYGVKQREMEDTLGMQSLREDIAELQAKGDGELTRLRTITRGRDPDDAFSDVPYEKGRFFAGFLESRIGRARLDAFLRDYFAHFAFHSASTEQFLDYLDKQLLSHTDAKVTRAEVLAWIDGPGLPATVIEPVSNAFVTVDIEKNAWLGRERTAVQLQTSGWTTQQWQHFLDNLPKDISAAQLRELDAAFRFTAATNNVLAHSWFMNAIRANYSPAYPRLEAYLTGIGRRKLVKDLYEELLKSPNGKHHAQAIYAKARPLYQVPLAEQLDELLGRPLPQ